MKYGAILLLTTLVAVPCRAASPSLEDVRLVQHYASRYNVPGALIAAFIDVESRWNPRARSAKGAMGLMQLMPATARRFGAFNPYDPDQNIAAGTRYLTVLMWEFDGDMRLVAAAYYAGDRWVGQKQLAYRNPDVVAYVESVRRHYIERAASRPQRSNP